MHSEAGLLRFKAEILAGEIDDLAETGNRLSGRTFEESSLFWEVQALTKNVDAALEKMGKARELVEHKKEIAAEKFLLETSALWPQAKFIKIKYLWLRGGNEFDRKDFATAAKTYEEAYRLSPDDPMQTMGYASARSLRYALTGEEKYKQEALTAVEKARGMCLSSPVLAEPFEEYRERIMYRLDTREILSKEEYDSRFRQKTDAKKK
jgi:tetratricopeptide (TPR) repeat protein